MEQQALDRVGSLAPKRNGNLRPVQRVEQGEECDALAIRVELLSGLEGDRAAAAIAAEKIRPVRLDSSYLRHVQSSHVFDGCQWRDIAV